MTAQKVLTEKKSTYGGPYGFYTVTLTPSNRTSSGVTVKCDVSAHLQYADSYTGYRVTCGIYIGGKWTDFVIYSGGGTTTNGLLWKGTSPKTASTTVTISGLSATQTEITGIQFRSLHQEAGNGPQLNATACSNLTIDYYTAPEQTPAPALADTSHISGISYVYINGSWQ